MNATKHLGLILFLTLAAGVATAAITHSDVRAAKAVTSQETTGEIARIVITATRQQQAAAEADDCENPIARVVVIGKRDQVAAK
jgi:hypothetical protein